MCTGPKCSFVFAALPSLEAMSLAVERAAIILVCLSQKYKDSPVCRTGKYTRTIIMNICRVYKVKNTYSDLHFSAHLLEICHSIMFVKILALWKI